MCVILAKGDITRRDAILWGYTIAECEPFLRACIRDITFREAVLAFLGVNPPPGPLQRGRNDFPPQKGGKRGRKIDRRILQGEKRG